MTGFLIGVGAGDFESRVKLEFSSPSAFTPMFYVKVPSDTHGAPSAEGGQSASVMLMQSGVYRLNVRLPAGDSLVSVASVESLRFNVDGLPYTYPGDSVKQLVKIYSVGGAHTGGIASSGFRNATSLVEVNLPNCESVGEFTFAGCSSLRKFVGGSLGIMYDRGFKDCTSLTEFTATRTAQICRRVWDGCSSLRDLSLPGCSFFYSDADCIGTLSALQYLRFPDKTLAEVKAMPGYESSIAYRTGVTLVCSDQTQVIT